MQQRMSFVLERVEEQLSAVGFAWVKTRAQNSAWLWRAYRWIHALVYMPIVGPGPFFAMDFPSGQSGDGPALDSVARTVLLSILGISSLPSVVSPTHGLFLHTLRCCLAVRFPLDPLV